jgi:hypothetical protein
MIPFDFILDYLYPYEPAIKKIFGQHVLYSEDKIILALRKNNKNSIDNGLWIATDFEHHISLENQFKSLRKLTLYNIKKWLLLPDDAEDFEKTAIQICELVKKGDIRIGVISKQ